MSNMKLKMSLTILIIIASLIPITSATYVETLKTHSPDKPSFAEGETVEFTIVISVLESEGGSIIPISDFIIVDHLPEGLTYVASSQMSTPTPGTPFIDHGNGTLEWRYGPGPFTDDPHASITFEAIVNENAPSGQWITNTAQAFYFEQEGAPRSEPSVSDSIRIESEYVGGIVDYNNIKRVADAYSTYVPLLASILLALGFATKIK